MEPASSRGSSSPTSTLQFSGRMVTSLVMVVTVPEDVKMGSMCEITMMRAILKNIIRFL
jgi:hypothetical protein